ncbi:hypothetical protein FA13DRAFT_1792393 [Coprinellus micaceus]|uniref:Transmembrane protein n=1 Tax=Coprinellus micaceus TaxID=71717 RepID=A0A4Y7T8C4_COPMI|nr:hypothetical protein FA13DRAFT_1792393 [Coprinellus micaceus]
MPSYLARYEDTAAIFTYAGTWRAGSPTEDPLGNQYSQSSFTLTNTKSSTFSFSFYGSEVSVFGAKRSNHGRYQVSLDGVVAPVATGQADPARFNETLYTAKTTLGVHNLTMINLEDLYLDIDSVSWLANVGNDNEVLTIDRKEDTDPSFVYAPSDAWSATPPPVTTFSQGSGHVTSRSGSRFVPSASPWSSRNTLIPAFLGDAIALYGPVGTTGATSYSVTVGCLPPSFHSAWNNNNIAQSQLLYYGANLGGGSHNLTLKLESVTDSAQILALDYAEIYSTPSILSSKSSEDGTCSSSGSSGSNAPVGLIVGVAVAGFIALLAIGLLGYLYYLYRKGQFNFSGRPAPSLPNMAHSGASSSGPGYHTTPFILPSNGSGYSGYTAPAQTPNTTMGMAVHSHPAAYYHPTDSLNAANRAVSPEATSSSDVSLSICCHHF